MLRIVKKWSIKPLIYVCFAIALGLTVIVEAQGTRKDILGLAWDMGAVTTGPVTVPLVISLGNGIAASVRHAPSFFPASSGHYVNVMRQVGVSDNPLNGFGVVTLASVIPAIVGAKQPAFALSVSAAFLCRPFIFVPCSASARTHGSGRQSW
jgi:hypothetical protein